MGIQKVSDAQIAITIVPKRARWPEPRTGSVWAAAHCCVDAWHNLIRKVDLDCAEAEQDRELAAGGIAHRRAELCDQAMTKLANFRLLEIAEKALINNINALERLSDRDPEQGQMHQKLTRALEDLRAGIEATRRMVQERCKMREGGQHNAL
jgi:hypothetical protein